MGAINGRDFGGGTSTFGAPSLITQVLPGPVVADLQRPTDMPELRTLSLHQQVDQGGGCYTWPTRWDYHLSLFFPYAP